MVTPGGEIATAVYGVERIGGSTQATMRWNGGEIPVMDLELDGDLMTFAWDPGFYMQCRLERGAKNQFKGACRDSRENVGPAVFSPPGTEVSADDIDFHKAFELWNVPMEEYIRERYPHPSDSKARDLSEPEELPSRLIDVGGRRLNVVEVGSGDVTVVLESGIGDNHRVWRQVQENLSGYARVVSYDRAGLGLSDVSEDERSPADLARDLQDLLEAGGYAPPLVMVGHHAGAFVVLAYEMVNKGDVAGIVLLDPAHVEEDDRLRAVDAPSWEQYVDRKRTFFSAVSPAAASEFEAYVDALEEPAIIEGDWPSDIPVVVLSGQNRIETPRWVGETVEGLRVKEELHHLLAKELGGKLVPSTRSGGYIHMEDPDLVIEAVKEILDALEE